MIRLILLCLIFGQVHAQTSFYIAPEIGTKIELTSSSVISNQQHVFNGSPNFEYQNQSAIYPKTLSPILLGLNFRVNFNNKVILSLGAGQDGGSSGAKVYFNTFDSNTNTYVNNQVSYYKGYSFGRYQLSTQLQLFNKKQNNVYFDFNLGLLHRSGATTILPEGVEKSTHLIDENNGMLQIRSETYKSNNTSLFMSFGLTDKISFKNVYIGDISVSYLLSNRIMSVVSSNINVSTQTENKSYSFNSISKGSGIYFKISRDIQFYPWKKKKSKIK